MQSFCWIRHTLYCSVISWRPFNKYSYKYSDLTVTTIGGHVIVFSFQDKSDANSAIPGDVACFHYMAILSLKFFEISDKARFHFELYIWSKRTLIVRKSLIELSRTRTMNQLGLHSISSGSHVSLFVYKYSALDFFLLFTEEPITSTLCYSWVCLSIIFFSLCTC